MVDCRVALACPSRFFGATDQAVKADTSDCRQSWQSTAFVYYKTVSAFGSIVKHRLVFEKPEWLVCVCLVTIVLVGIWKHCYMIAVRRDFV
jgi:hypothetical protein